MKKALIATLFIVQLMTMTSMAQEGMMGGYDIAMQVEGIEDSVAILGYHRGEKRYAHDTADISDDGSMRFVGEDTLKTGLYFLYSKGFYFEFVVEETRFSLTTKREDPYGNLTVEGSPTNELFKDFQMIMVQHQQSIRQLTESLDSTASKEDSVAVFDQLRELNESNGTSRDSLRTLAGSGYMYSLLTLMDLNPELRFYGDSLTADEKRAEYNKFRSNYFSELDLNSEGLLRTPIFHAKLMEYFDRVTFQHPDSIINALDEFLVQCKDNEELYSYTLGVMFERYQNPKIMGMDKIFVHLSDEYYLKGKAPWADETMLQKLRDEMVFYRENQIGMKAPQIHFIDTLNQPRNLYSINADYLILYFYSPTCGHCKKKTPVLKEIYDKLDGKAEVAAVCTDSDVEKWKKFVRDLELSWYNFGDPKNQSNFRVQYNVRSTPQLYILDKDKKIIAKRLDVDQVEEFINDQIMLSELDKS